MSLGPNPNLRQTTKQSIKQSPPASFDCLRNASRFVCLFDKFSNQSVKQFCICLTVDKSVPKAEPQPLRPIGERWLDRFESCNPEIAGIWTRQIDAVRFKATNYDGVERWFDAVTELWTQHQYAADHVYNMDESGFAVGASQSSRALVNIREASSCKQIGSRQEWITAIDCVGAAGTAIPPLLIFKAKHTNDAWNAAQAP